MTREQVLSILYSERTRLQEKYNMSGWGLGAVIAAISALAVQIISIAYENDVNWDLSFMICLALFDIVLCCVFAYQLIRRKLPVFIRYSDTLRFYSILFVLYFLFHIVWMCYSNVILKECHLYYISLFSLICFVVLYSIVSCNFFHKHGFLNTKSDKLAFTYPFLLFAVILYLCICFFRNNTIEQESLLVGIYLFAIIFMLTHLFKNESEMINNVDILINSVLYDDLDNYDNVIEELEVVTVGIDVERMLLRNNKSDVNSNIDNIVRQYDNIMSLLSSNISDDINEKKVEDCFLKADKNVENIKDTAIYISKMIGITWGYNRYIRNKKLSKMMYEIEAFIVMHKLIYGNFKNRADFNTFRTYFIEEYKTTQAKDVNNLS